jgi:parvulin-like peptidyl-prolyl isomerase
MKRFNTLPVAAIFLLALSIRATAQEVIDGIAARVDNDIILLSDMRRLARYQSFLDDSRKSDSEILNLLIDQWIVRNEAKAALFPQPSDDDVKRSLERLKRSFSSPEEFQERKKQAGLTDEDVLRLLRSELYLTNYLDSRFRASINVDDKDIEEFYKTRLLPRAEARGQTPPTLEAARGRIQEVLLQRAINVQADKWLKESRARLRIEILLDENAK